MTSKETFTHYQPQGNSDPAHTATAPGGLSAKAPAMTPLMLDTSSRKLVAWDGTTDGAAVGILAVAADQTSTTLTFYKSGTFRYEDVLWPEGCQRRDEKTDRVCRNGNQHRLTLPFITKGRLCGFFTGFFMSMYTTAQLLAANEQKFKFDPLFLRLFFRESYPFTTEKVYLSQIPGLVNMALYVSPIVSGEVIRSRGGSTSEFTPGYVKPKHEVNPQMTLRRLPDEDPQNLADPAYRRRRIIMQNMRDEELAIAQVEEMQAVSAVLKGKYTMTGEAFDPVEVDMGRSEENNITQSGGTEWSKRDKSTYDPTDDIEAYALNASGVVNIIVFDPKGWALFRSFKAVKEKLDTRRGSHSELETAVKDLGKAVSYKGMYGDVAIVVYSGQYVENGVKKNFLPDNTMVLGNTQARGLRTYGCIQDADAQREGINASARYPKNWVTTGDPAREFTMIQSAPLMLLADPDEFVSVQLA